MPTVINDKAEESFPILMYLDGSVVLIESSSSKPCFFKSKKFDEILEAINGLLSGLVGNFPRNRRIEELDDDWSVVFLCVTVGAGSVYYLKIMEKESERVSFKLAMKKAGEKIVIEKQTQAFFKLLDIPFEIES